MFSMPVGWADSNDIDKVIRKNIGYMLIASSLHSSSILIGVSFKFLKLGLGIQLGHPQFESTPRWNDLLLEPVKLNKM